MGCCNNDNCPNSGKKAKRKLPWVGVIGVVLVVLVAVNWH
jgi:hypothetical protein